MFLVMKCSFNFSLDRSTCIAFKLYKPLNFEMISRQGILILSEGWPACLDLDLKKKERSWKTGHVLGFGIKNIVQRCRGIQQKLLPAKHTLTIPQYITRVPLGSRTSIMFNLCDKLILIIQLKSMIYKNLVCKNLLG